MTGLPLQAHVIAPQYAVFDNGALHAVVTQQLVVPVLALGIALGRGQRGSATAGGLLWLASFATGALLWNRPGNPFAGFGTPLAFLAAGAALGSQGRWGAGLAAFAAVVIGVYVGGIGRQEDVAAGWPGWFTAGVAVGASLILFFAAEAARRYRRPWQTIPVRITASWLLAIGVMLFGLVLKPPAKSPAPAIDATAADTSPCPGPHKHGLDGEFICLPVPTIDDKGTPSSIAKYGNAPPVLSDPAPAKPPGGGAAP